MFYYLYIINRFFLRKKHLFSVFLHIRDFLNKKNEVSINYILRKYA